jgi:uncharacterized protein (DUF488 family)
VSRVIYTIGTSNRTIEQFISLCKQFDLQAVADVRRFPVSKLDHFKKDKLASTLQKEKVRYFYLGNLLGGFREKGYGEHTRTPEFSKGIEELEKIASEFVTAFLCAEKFPWKCHRRFISLELVRKGWRVIHILDKEKIWEPQEIPTLFDRDT